MDSFEILDERQKKRRAQIIKESIEELRELYEKDKMEGRAYD